jgi:hypothetical protein
LHTHRPVWKKLERQKAQHVHSGKEKKKKKKRKGKEKKNFLSLLWLKVKKKIIFNLVNFL